jgi:hypothetical protein
LQTTLLSVLDLVHPKFLGLCRIIILLLALATKIAVSISLTKDCSISSCGNPASRMLLKAATGMVAKPFNPIVMLQNVVMKAF